uniref:Uncharacterized protein n=1 Tax=Fulvimarina pelagi TaxID=217511 RepID=A0A0P0ZAD0_9HYPH|nr:hypothetical protein [Fulvimarina pelagi]
MEMAESDIVEFPRLAGRIGIVDRRLVHQTEFQANARTIFQIDGGKEDGHGGASRSVG